MTVLLIDGSVYIYGTVRMLDRLAAVFDRFRKEEVEGETLTTQKGNCCAKKLNYKSNKYIIDCLQDNG